MTNALQPSPSGSPARSVRVMVVDDSVVVRGLVARWIGQIPGFVVVATAPNGRVALEVFEEARADIVLLDLDMPEMDGLATLPVLLARRPATSVIVVSTLTQRNAEISLRCLAMGAVDYLPKPESRAEIATGLDFRREMLARLEGISHRHCDGDPLQRRAWRAVPGPAATPTAHPPLRTPLVSRHPCLLVGASTGGPRAVVHVMKGLERVAECMPILLVQHMPPIFTAVFAEQLAHETGIPAGEGRDGERLEAGRVYVAPGGRHMGLALVGGAPVIRLDDGAPVRHCRPSVDVLFRDAARVIGASAVALVLTGMGTDGTEGARALVEAGGAVIAQDEATSIVWGMPGSIAKAGLARSVLPLDAIAPALDAMLGRRRA